MLNSKIIYSNQGFPYLYFKIPSLNTKYNFKGGYLVQLISVLDLNNKAESKDKK